MDKEKKCFDSRTRAGCGRAVSAAENPAYNFDSRTRVRCDKDTSGEWYISINAPVWARLLACYRSAWRVLIRATRQLKAQHVCFDNTILLLDCIDTSQDKCEETSAFRFAVPSHSELRW